MIQLIFMFLMFMFNFLFMNMKHPLAMGLTLMIQTVLVTMFLGLINKTFWFSYILFLVFIGGMLVMFMYMTSLASNEMFSFSSKMIVWFFLSSVLFFFSSFLIDKNLWMNFYNMELISIENLETFYLENSLLLNKLFNFPTNLLSIMLMIYLFITLIAIVKITKLFKGPLRPMFN